MINLEYEYVDGKIKMKETGRMRKDRYSALAYGYYVSCLLERELRNSKSRRNTKTPLCAYRMWSFEAELQTCSKTGAESAGKAPTSCGSVTGNPPAPGP